MKNEIQGFCENNSITEDQFYGKETVGGSLSLNGLTSIPDGFNPTVGGSLLLDGLTSIPEGFNPTVGGSLSLDGLTSIPEGFNPTVGGDLWLSGLTSIPEGFNPTVGGSLSLRGLSSKTTKLKSPIVTSKNKLLFWKYGKYVSADGILTEVVSKKGNIYKVRKLHSPKEFYIITDGTTHAHGDSIKSAKEDLRFKLIAEKLKKDPINADTELTVMHYRTITGACDIGCRDFMTRNNIEFKVENDKTVEINPIKAKELMPLLEKNNSYGLERFRSLITF